MWIPTEGHGALIEADRDLRLVEVIVEYIGHSDHQWAGVSRALGRTGAPHDTLRPLSRVASPTVAVRSSGRSWESANLQGKVAHDDAARNTKREW